MRKIIALGILFLSTATFASGTDENMGQLTEDPKEAKTIDECCERSITVYVEIEQWNIVFTATGTARGCVSSETNDDPKNMDLACNIASKVAASVANDILAKAIANYTP